MFTFTFLEGTLGTILGHLEANGVFPRHSVRALLDQLKEIILMGIQEKLFEIL